MESVPFEELPVSDLVIDRIYEGGSKGHAADDPLARLLPVGNQGGFRYKGSFKREGIRLIVLYTSGEDRDWPDTFDPYSGTLRVHHRLVRAV